MEAKQILFKNNKDRIVAVFVNDRIENPMIQCCIEPGVFALMNISILTCPDALFDEYHTLLDFLNNHYIVEVLNNK